MNIKIIILSTLLALSLIISACNKQNERRKNTPEENAQTTSKPSELAMSQDKTLKISYCPNITDLTKIGLIWITTDGKWRSREQSFAKTVENFQGAQWFGVIVGQVICLYKGKESFDFPIALEPIKTTIIPEPNGTNWSSKSTDYKSCQSGVIANCPFFVKQELGEKNVYEEIKYQENKE